MLYDLIPTPVVEDPKMFNVADDPAQRLQALGAQSATLVQDGAFPSFDAEGSLALVPYFDALVTDATGLYNGETFSVQSHSVPTLASFIGGLIASHDDDIKLLYMVEKFDKPVEQDFDKQPLTLI